MDISPLAALGFTIGGTCVGIATASAYRTLTRRPPRDLPNRVASSVFGDLRQPVDETAPDAYAAIAAKASAGESVFRAAERVTNKPRTYLPFVPASDLRWKRMSARTHAGKHPLYYHERLYSMIIRIFTK